jgi:hypothetical protein
MASIQESRKLLCAVTKIHVIEPEENWWRVAHPYFQLRPPAIEGAPSFAFF